MKILIAGYGNIGKLEYQKYSTKYDVDIYDKFKDEYNNLNTTEYDFCIVCVDTPLTKTKTLDISAVEDVIKTVKTKIFICRSTLPINTSDYLMDKYKIKFVMYPEFYGTTQHANNFTFNFSILGGHKEDCYKVQHMLQGIYDATHTFHVVNAKTAEIVKLFENTVLFSKVVIFAELWEICNKFGVDFEEARECLTEDIRIGKYHTFIDPEHPFAKSHCMDKDVPALAEQGDSDLFKAIIKANKLKIKKYKN